MRNQIHQYQPLVGFEVTDATNIEITGYNTGIDPVIAIYEPLVLSDGVENFYLHRLRMRPIKLGTDASSYDAFKLGAHHGVLHKIVVEGVPLTENFRNAFLLRTYATTGSHICFLDCTVDFTNEGYSLNTEGDGTPQNITALGGLWNWSAMESHVRLLAMDRIAFFATNLDCTADVVPKSTIRFQFTTYGSCYRCRFVGGDLHIGQVQQSGAPATGDASNIRIDACYLQGAFQWEFPDPDVLPNPAFHIEDKSTNVAIVNCYLDDSEKPVTEMAIKVEDDGVSNVLIAHNTCGHVTVGTALRDQSSVSVVSAQIKNNLFLMANQSISNNLYVKRFGGTLSGYSFDGNAWTYTSGEEWEVNGYQNVFTEWLALAEVGTDYLTHTSLDANLRPTVPTIVPVVGGVFEDYYGNKRTVVWAGAVGPVPPPPP